MRKIVFVTLLSLLSMASCNKKVDKQADEPVVIKSEVVEERTGEELKIVAIIKVKPEAVNKILPVFQPLVQGSQEEEGCVFYNLHQDISDSTKFIMVEEWVSQDAINRHNASEHYKTFQEASKGLIESSEVSVMKLIY